MAVSANSSVMNKSISEPQTFPLIEFISYVAWMIQGLVIGGGNLLLAASILKYPALRMCKEYLVLMGLALADGLNLVGLLCAGVTRIVLMLLGERELVSARDCLLRPDFILWTFTQPLEATMLSVVAQDRLLFMLWPLQYMGRSAAYAKYLLGITYAACISYGAIGAAMAFGSQTHDLFPFCRIAEFFANPKHVGLFYAWMFRNSPICSAMLSILLMLGTWPVYRWRQLKRLKVTTNLKLQLRRQKAFTKSIALSTACTLVLFVIPLYLAYFLIPKGYMSLGMSMIVIVNCNPGMNIIIYQLRHKESQMAVKGLIKGKVLPVNIELWNTTSKKAVVSKVLAGQQQQAEHRV